MVNDPTDTLRFLSQSKTRIDLLRAARDEGELDRHEMEDRLDVSRRTVVRAVDTLAEHGYLDTTGEGIRLTNAGELLVDSYDAFSADFEVVDRLKPLLSNLPAGTVDLDPRLLTDAEVLTASRSTPYGLLDRTLSLRREATHVREVASIVEKRSVEQLAERVDSDPDLRAEIVVSKSIAESAMDHPEYRSAQQAVLDSDRVELTVVSSEPSLLLCIADETVALGAMADGKPHALAVSDRAEVRQWAERTFERYRDRAVPVAQL